MSHAGDAALREGRSVASPEGEADFLDVLELATRHQDDPRIIPTLVSFIATGNRVIGVLAGFGEQAVAQVVDVAASSTKPAADVHAALVTLERMLETTGGDSLGAASRVRIVGIARSRLNGTLQPTVAFAAVELAVATREPARVQRVRDLSQDASAVRAPGISDDLVPLAQKKAQSALDTAFPTP